MKVGKAALAVAAGIGLVASGIGHAEVLSVTGELAAPHRDASLLRSLAIARFDGEDGLALAGAVERALSNTHFDLMAGRGGRDNAEGTLSGAVRTGVEERSFKRKEKRCAVKKKGGGCEKEENVEVRCRERTVTVTANFRVLRNADGRILYSAEKPNIDQRTRCEGEDGGPAIDEIVSEAMREIADGLRSDIAPSVRTYNVRVLESTKGLSKLDADRFKAAVRMTKRDAPGACAAWEAMNREAPNHAATVFNLALCAEQRGDYANAMALYRQAQPLIGGRGGEASEGVSRVAQLIAGREDAAARGRRR